MCFDIHAQRDQPIQIRVSGECGLATLREWFDGLDNDNWSEHEPDPADLEGRFVMMDDEGKFVVLED